ncbi:hypothetical protein RI129_010916 [Pyrocoelia pectoralis]|uniref:Leucine-rich repeat protein n=1 Tax=Pyrocoelia pectoralis TaxID=417401 RepID=A0AAN7UZU6_9COLE
MWRHFFFYLICMSGTYDVTYGVTCDDHNTVILETRDLWRLPINAVQCVDIRSLGNRSFIPDFVGLETVTALQADHMRLKTVPDFALIKLPNLELLDLSGNQLRKIAKDVFVPYQKLDTLLLNDNEVMLPKTPFLNSQSIKTLFLSNNKIKKLKYNTFVQLQNLVKIYLDRNLLNQVNPNVFTTLKHLKYLHLGSNQLKVLPQIVLFQPEARLIVKGNPFNKTNATKKEPAPK